MSLERRQKTRARIRELLAPRRFGRYTTNELACEIHDAVRVSQARRSYVYMVLRKMEDAGEVDRWQSAGNWPNGLEWTLTETSP